jgi:hypothetical protein
LWRFFYIYISKSITVVYYLQFMFSQLWWSDRHCWSRWLLLLIWNILFTLTNTQWRILMWFSHLSIMMILNLNKINLKYIQLVNFRSLCYQHYNKHNWFLFFYILLPIITICMIYSNSLTDIYYCKLLIHLYINKLKKTEEIIIAYRNRS